MAKKFYAVKVGKKPGVYRTWDECKEQTAGYPGAEFKGFNDEEAALNYLEEEKEEELFEDTDMPTAYVDGSYDEETGEYSYGVVFLYDARETFLSGKDSKKEMSNMRNVAGEILGAIAAMQFAMDNAITEFVIKHDYQGIASWCTGEWQCKNPCTMAYRDFYNKAFNRMDIHFNKVQGHSGVFYNELADALAKRELNKPIKKSLEEYLQAAEDLD